MSVSKCEHSALLPTLFIHSDFDSVALQYDEADNSGSVQQMLERNECDEFGATTAGSCSSTTFECTDFDGCSVPFRSCRHDLRIQGTDDWPCFASDEIARFFDTHR